MGTVGLTMAERDPLPYSALYIQPHWRLGVRRLLGIAFGLMVSLAAYAEATTIGAQQPATLTCSPMTIDAVGPSVTFTCSVENFPPNASLTVVGTFETSPRQLITDGAGQAGFTFLIPEFGVCAPLSGAPTITASADGAEASTTIAVAPFTAPSVSCGPPAVPARPRLTG
jgi:hypothetical protein